MSSSATIENVTDYSTLTSSSGSIGGIAGRVTGGTITMKNVVMKGSYYNGFGYSGCFIGLISSGATTNLINGCI